MDRAALSAELRRQLQMDAEHSSQRPDWTKRRMPAIEASLAKAKR